MGSGAGRPHRRHLQSQAPASVTRGHRPSSASGPEPGTQLSHLQLAKWGPGVPKAKHHAITVQCHPDRVTQPRLLGDKTREDPHRTVLWGRQDVGELPYPLPTAPGTWNEGMRGGDSPAPALAINPPPSPLPSDPTRLTLKGPRSVSGAALPAEMAGPSGGRAPWVSQPGPPSHPRPGPGPERPQQPDSERAKTACETLLGPELALRK